VRTGVYVFVNAGDRENKQGNIAQSQAAMPMMARILNENTLIINGKTSLF
jgi:hypothetical protein